MNDKEKICKHTLGGYGVSKIDHAKDCMCYRKGQTTGNVTSGTKSNKTTPVN